MNDPLYQRELLRLAAASGVRRRLACPCAEGRAANPLCGDEIIFDLVCDDGGRVRDVGFECHACLLVQASAELLAEQATGQDESGIEAIRDDVARMLQGKPEGRGKAAIPFDVFSGVAEHRNRHHCVLLPFDALLKAFAARQKSALRFSR